MMFDWLSQVGDVWKRDWRRAFHNAYLLSFAIICLLAGLVILRFASGGAGAFLFLQMQLFLLPLFAILMGCGCLHDDLEEMPVLFSQPLFRSAYLGGKWLSQISLLALATALAIGPYALFRSGTFPLFLLWAQGILLGGVFVAIGLSVATWKRDRARGLIASLLVWLVLVFGYDALAFFAVQTGHAARWPSLWVGLLMANPTDIFRTGVLLSLEEIPFNVPATQQGILWILDHLTPLTPVVCGFWSFLLLMLTTWRLQRGLE